MQLVGEGFDRLRRDAHEFGVQPHALVAQVVDAGGDAGTVEEVQGDGGDLAVGGGFEEGAFGPFVEGTHRRAAPDLIIDLAGGVADVGPAGGEAEVPAEDEGHFVFGVALGTLNVRGIDLLEKLAGFGPDRVERFAENGLFQRFALSGGDGLETGIGAVDFKEFGGTHGEHGAPLDDLEFHAHFKHVGSGGHDDVGLLDLGEHGADFVAAAGLDAGLVDRASDDVGSPHRKGRRGGGGRADAAAEADAEGGGVGELFLQAVAQGEHGGQEGEGGAVVGVAGGISFGGEVLGHRNLCGEGGLIVGDAVLRDELRQQSGRGRAEPFGGDFLAGDFGDDAVGGDDGTVVIAVDAVDAVEDGGEGEVHEGGGFDEVDAALEVELDDGKFVGGFVGAVDEVKAEGQVVELGGEAVDGGFDFLNAEAGSAEGAEDTGPGGGDDEVCGGDAVGHGAGHVGKAHAVVDAEGRVAELGDALRGGGGEDEGAFEGVDVGAEGGDSAEAEGDAFALMLEGVEGLAEVEEGGPHFSGIRNHPAPSRCTPPAAKDRRRGCRQWTGPGSDGNCTVHGDETLFEREI